MEHGPELAQLALCTLPGTLRPSQLLLQAVDPATGLVQASLEAVSHAAGLLQLPGGSEQLGTEGVLSFPAHAEALLQLLLAGLTSSLHLCQLPLQPQDLWEAMGAQEALTPDPPASADLPRPLASAPSWHVTTGGN